MTQDLLGFGFPDRLLTESQIGGICAAALAPEHWNNQRVLAIIPDLTRTACIDRLFRSVTRELAGRVRALDFMIALGTHPPLDEQAILRRVGLTRTDYRQNYSWVHFYNHEWHNPAQLVNIGRIGADEVAELSGGLLNQSVEVTINRRILDYDRLLVIGPVFPHEVVGFSGGNKYFFPGIAGQEIIDLFHWLGALITSRAIIGVKHTPVRAVVDRAAALIPVERFCFATVEENDGPAGLWFAAPEAAWSAAADLSAQRHVIRCERPYKRVLACAPAMYEDLWTGGKCMYKIEPAVADGGEVVIHAPHITRLSISHGEAIEQIGYHVRDYYLKQWPRFQHIPGGILAHSTHVKGSGEYIDGVEKPRIRVTLATGIAEKLCRKIDLGYCDPRTIDKDKWRGREEEGVLVVERAGERLFRISDFGFRISEKSK
ncbi:MAG TPA: lactate racemase domain-containing protein [bacterium]|mgnify:CR=1 FL=1|nr:lactate racemase domain-containing protein [bacterium]HPG47424.1 lactate racemase domain-containing protein [bacterium]HPM98848.1 lactate racemase domain-containing protein [bacterium]